MAMHVYKKGAMLPMIIGFTDRERIGGIRPRASPVGHNIPHAIRPTGEKTSGRRGEGEGEGRSGVGGTWYCKTTPLLIMIVKAYRHIEQYVGADMPI